MATGRLAARIPRAASGSSLRWAAPVTREELQVRLRGSDSVDVSTVVDVDNEDGAVFVVDAQQDAVVTATGAAQALELVAQRFAQPVRISCQRAGDELDDRVRDPSG